MLYEILIHFFIGNLQCAKEFGCQYNCKYLPEVGYQCTCPQGLKLASNARTCNSKLDCSSMLQRNNLLVLKLRKSSNKDILCQPILYSLRNLDGLEVDSMEITYRSITFEL